MIVVFGSINLDLFVRVERLPAPGETVLGPRLETAPGGKGANQALAAKRAGAAAVRLVGRVGRDPFAAPALELLRAGAVDLDRVEPGDEPTGCAFIAIDDQGQNQIVVASGANRSVDQAQVPDDWLGPRTLLVVQMEVPHAATWAVVRRARAAGARIVLNAAPAGAAPVEALAALDLLIVNEVEVLAVADGLGVAAADAIAAGRALAPQLDIPVVVTLGQAGAVACVGAGGWRLGTLPVRPVDTVGAGDAFVGALVAALDRGLGFEPALRRAAVAGSLACTVAGAQPSLPTADAIEARLAELPPPRPVVAE
jgi:ribokinase